MLNHRSFKTVQQASFDSIFCPPLYDNYCFANLPQTIKGLLTGKQSGGLPADVLIEPHSQYECVVMILMDGFGWCFLKNYLDELPFLRRFMNDGVVSQMTSQFPSTTVAHLTCLNTGLSVGQSGLYEWYYYEPLVGAVICPLRFAFAGESNNSLKNHPGTSQGALFPFTSFYQDLKHDGIPSTIFYHRSYALSPFSQATGQGAKIVPYASYADAIFKLADHLMQQPRGYYYLYLGDIDSASHEFGPHAKEVDFMIRDIFHLLEKRLGTHPILANPKAAFIVTADHGHIATYPEKTLYLNQICPELLTWMQKDFKGHPLAPAGSPRDYFLYIKKNFIEEAHQLLKMRLEGRARVYKTQTLIDNGIFGPLPLAARFLERIGNLVVLPFEKESVFWYEQDRFEHHFLGNHGGLSREEMESIFLFRAGD
jgi:predicted AlkP superfamily pyrophosphatase or phosphodiesterase